MSLVWPWTQNKGLPHTDTNPSCEHLWSVEVPVKFSPSSLTQPYLDMASVLTNDKSDMSNLEGEADESLAGRLPGNLRDLVEES